MLDRFEVKIVDGNCEVVAINGTELNCVESYKIEQENGMSARITVSFFADHMNIFAGKEDSPNAYPATSAE